MRGTFNAVINIQSGVAGNEDSVGNLTYTSANILTNEQARKYEITRNKLTDDGKWITKKFVNFMIFDVDTDLTTAVNVVCGSKNYKIEKIISPDGFARSKYRIIETDVSESDN